MRKSGVLWGISLIVLLSLAACTSGRSDEALANEIKARIFSTAELRDANLEVTVSHGEATLKGEVASDADRLAAYKLAAETEGVRKVHDQMTVRVAEVTAPAPEPEPEPAPAPAPKPRRASAPAPAPQPAAPPVATPAPTPTAAPAPAPAAPAAQPAEPARPKTMTVQVPAGTVITIRMIDSVDSEKHRAGQVFQASLEEPLVVDGVVLAERGADAYVKLIEARSAGRLAGRSELRLQLIRLMIDGRPYTVESSTYEQVGSSRGKRTAATVGTGAAIGAAIGAIAGGGKGAAIGAAAGAGGGTAVQVLTKGEQVRVPSETLLEFRLDVPVQVTYTPK